MEVFFAEPEQVSGRQITLDEFESKHILHTLKKKKGDEIRITDGCGALYHAKIIETAKRIRLEYSRSHVGCWIYPAKPTGYSD